MNINISLFGHILLDAELNGRFGVQGNTFKNTFAYFHAWLEQYLQSSSSELNKVNQEQLNTLSKAIKGLCEAEQNIATINTSHDKDHRQLNAFTTSLAEKIQTLPNDKTLLLPGGWSNKKGHGHAMIYEFKKNADGQLLFSIYNSGSGIDEHQLLDGSRSDRFHPVKTYQLLTQDAAALTPLLKTLVLPKMPHHPERNYDHNDYSRQYIENYDATILYNQIKMKAPIARIISADTPSIDISTAGQISGTCSQRSIHQMLKVHFDTLPNYRRCILAFKMHALREFITSHPAPRSKEINDFIILGIENNLKILQEPDVFDNISSKNTLAEELIRLKQDCLKPEATKSLKHTQQHIQSQNPAYALPLMPAPLDFKPNQALSISASKPKKPAFIQLHNQTELEISQVQALLDNCQKYQNTDPYWVIQQIEQIMIHLPLPDDKKALKSDIPFYSKIKSEAQFETFISMLEKLGNIHQQTTQACLGGKVTPTTLVTHASFLALYQYVTEQASAGGNTASTSPIEHVLYKLFSALKHMPHMATKHPEYDQRFTQLKNMYDKRKTPPASLLEQYKTLLNASPDLKQILQQLYDKSSNKPEAKFSVPLKNKDCEALYYLFTQLDENGDLTFDSNLNDTRLKPLLANIKRSINFEQSVAKQVSIFFDVPHLQAKVELKPDPDNNISLCSPLSTIQAKLDNYHSLHFEPIKFQQLLLEQSGMPTSKILQALIPEYVGIDPMSLVYSTAYWYSPTSNQIQIKENDLFIRNLHQLRTTKKNQIQLTLDFFASDMDKLSDPNIQKYIMFNLFEPGLMHDLLKTEAEKFLTQFDNFIEAGLIQALDKKGNLSQISLYLMQLSLSVDCYMHQHEQMSTNPSTKRLISNYEQINKALTTTTNSSLVDELHRLRFIALMTLQEKDDHQMKHSELSDCLSSFFHIQNPIGNQTINLRDEFALQKLAHKFEDRLEAYAGEIDILETIKKEVCTTLKLQASEWQLAGEFPIYQLSNDSKEEIFNINATTGQIFNKDHWRLSVIPFELRSNQALKRLNLDPNLRWCMSMDGLSFVSADNNIRFQLDPMSRNTITSIQKKWAINSSEGSWYELQDRTVSQSLPAPLCDDSCATWANDDCAFVTKNHQPHYMQTSVGIEQLDEHSRSTGRYLQSNSKAHEALSSFEASSFVHVNLNQEQTTGTAELPRYGLKFIITNDSIQLDETPYFLTVAANPPFKPEVACLTCEDSKQNQYCILPIQRFYVDKMQQQTDGHQYLLSHDISSFIANDAIKQSSSNTPRYYSDTETYLTLPIIEGIPQANSASDALYLVYLYLASHEHEKAWDMLNAIPKSFPMEGTAEELKYLSWIFNALPYKVEDTNEHAFLNSPRDAACKLKAMTLYLQGLSEGKKTVLPTPENINADDPNGIYNRENAEHLILFKKELRQSIEEQYLTLIKTERHLRSQFALTDKESMSLLAFWHSAVLAEHGANNHDEEPKPNAVLIREYEAMNQTQSLKQENHHQSIHPSQMSTAPSQSNSFLCLKDVLIEKLSNKDTLKTMISDFDSAESIYRATLNELTEANELQAGEALYQRTSSQETIAKQTLLGSEIRNQLFQHAKAHQEALGAEVTKSWDAIISLANEALSTTHKIQVAAGQRKLLTQRDLLTAYVKADGSYYSKISGGLTMDQIARLHNMLHQCMHLEIEKQHATRLMNALDAISTTDNPSSVQLANVASILTSQHLPEAKEDPRLIFFQYEENILLRPRQLQAVSNLLTTAKDKQGFNESIEKVIMGGGKSKVILPLLAQKKANGANLVIVEVPRPLLATNHIDLLRTSQRLFGQNAVCFEFDRDSDCSAKRLEQIYHQFCDVKAGKNYLITTGEAMQSLELKYLELLLSKPASNKPNDIKTWETQTYWASKIVELIKQQGDVIIDEVHQGLLLKKKLNYTVGIPVPINKTLIHQSLDLYQFLHKHGFDETLEPRKLLEKLLQEPDSPLRKALGSLFETYGDSNNLKDDLRGYLSNESQPDWLDTLELDVKNSLAFYKEQLELLPQTLNRHYKEHYGPSKKADNPAFRRALAIPYSANDKPNERSQFSNPLETINYTIQSLFKEGLNQDLIKQMVDRWQQDARFELQHGTFDNIDATPVAQNVANLLKNSSFNSLNQINSDDPAHIHLLLQEIGKKTDVLEHILAHMILPEVTREPETLHSDAYNHVDLYRSVQGVSGTPANHSTFHQRLHFNVSTSLGSDGYIQTVLKEKNTQIKAAKFENLATYFDNLLQANTHAIIDINATFVGLNNLNVASALANHFEKRNADIKYILYFKENAEGNDVLHAYSIREKKSIVLTSSDPKYIQQQLNCPPEKYFTYYDQAHTVGVDIKQAPYGSALCLIDEDTSLQNFLQGVMRMRGLSEGQSIELIVPESMSAQSLNTLLENMQSNETKQLEQDNFYATLAKLNNIIRQQALSYLASIEDINTKHQYAQAFRSFLIETHSHELFDEYGAIYQIQDTTTLFQNHITTVMAKWQECLQTVKINNGNEDQLKTELETVAAKTLHHCPEKFKSPLHHQQNTEVEVQKEVMKENEAQKEVQKLVENIMEPGELKPIKSYSRWNKDELKDITFNGFTETTLNQYIPQPTDTLFSSNLHATSRYLEVFEGQEKNQVIGAYLKPVQAILYRIDQNNKISACLISNEEADELRSLLNEANSSALTKPAVWLESTLHTCLAGNQPTNINMQAEYHILHEQIRYFNGQFSELLDQAAPYLWLEKQPQEIFETFEEIFMPYRNTTENQISLLQQALLKEPEGLKYIANHSFSDLTTINWQEKYPKAQPSEIATLTYLASAISHANHTFYTLKSKNNPLNQLLPKAARAILNEHNRRLDKISHWLNRFKDSPPNENLLNILDDNETKELEAIFSIDLKLLKSVYEIKEEEPLNSEKALLLNLHLLSLLVKSPCIDDVSSFKTRVQNQMAMLKDPMQELRLHKPLLSLLFMNDNLSGEQFISVLKEINVSQADTMTLGLIINHPATPESALMQLLNEAKLSSSFIEQIANRTNDPETLNLLIEKYPPTLLQACFLASKNLSINIQAHLINGCKTNADFQSILPYISNCSANEIKHLLTLPLSIESISELLSKAKDENLTAFIQTHKNTMEQEYSVYKSKIEGKDKVDKTEYKKLIQSFWFATYRTEGISNTLPIEQKILMMQYAEPALTQLEAESSNFNLKVYKTSMRNNQTITVNQCLVLSQNKNKEIREFLLDNAEASSLIYGSKTLANALINNPNITKKEIIDFIQDKDATPEFVLLCIHSELFKENQEIENIIASHQNERIKQLAAPLKLTRELLSLSAKLKLMTDHCSIMRDNNQESTLSPNQTALEELTQKMADHDEILVQLYHQLTTMPENILNIIELKEEIETLILEDEVILRNMDSKACQDPTANERHKIQCILDMLKVNIWFEILQNPTSRQELQQYLEKVLSLEDNLKANHTDTSSTINVESISNFSNEIAEKLPANQTRLQTGETTESKAFIEIKNKFQQILKAQSSDETQQFLDKRDNLLK